MKRDTPQHPKVDALMDELDVPRYVAVGLLESLWHITGANTPEGNIGRFPNKSIARRLDWDGDADKLIDAMVNSGWLDRHDEHRLVIHDWPDHCEDAVHMKVARRAHAFADGSMPKLARFATSERETILKAYESKELESVATECTRDGHAVSTALAHTHTLAHTNALAHTQPSAVATPCAEPDGLGGEGEKSSSGLGGTGGKGGATGDEQFAKSRAFDWEAHQRGDTPKRGPLADVVQRAAEASGVNLHHANIAKMLRDAGVNSDAKVDEIAKRGDLTPEIVSQTIAIVKADSTVAKPAGVIAHRLATKTSGQLEDDIASHKRRAGA